MLDAFIDLRNWQKIQDKFSKHIDKPVSLIDENGEVKVLSNKFPLFCETVMNKNKALCDMCRADNFQKLKESKNQIRFYKCHAGLLNIMVPVEIEGKKVGALNISSISQGMPDDKVFSDLKRRTNVMENDLKDLYSDIKRSNVDSLKYLGAGIYTLSETVPQLEYESRVKDIKFREMSLLHKLSTILSLSLELDSILDFSVKFLKDSFKINRCGIIIFDQAQKATDKNHELDLKLAGDVKKTGNSLIINNADKTEEYSLYRSKKIIAFPLEFKNNILGALIFGADDYNLDDNEKKFLSTIIQQLNLSIENCILYKNIETQAITDPLTQVYNRRYFMEVFDRELERTKRNDRELSVIILDIDHFKAYNDNYGHLGGDELLREIVKVVKENLRVPDTLARYGGEEFVILLPETNQYQALHVAERIRKNVEDYNFNNNTKVTVSLGICTSNCKSYDCLKILGQADRMLYKSKNEGRNKIFNNVL